jgi:cob(I)alamin adenosyltransferase
MKILSKKKYEELKKYKEEYKKVVDDNYDLRMDLADVKSNYKISQEQVEYLRAELKKYKPVKKAGRPKKVTTEEKSKRKVGRPRKESK